ncbi:MAG TPA: PhoU domain-containing protein [Acidimicrobiales bacterium]|nr:PhoU domain-containing protein [Acidimicrobiales bacterium]
MSGMLDRTMSFEAALTEIDQRVLRLFAMVSEGLAAATAAFLDNDREAARQLVAADVEVDSLESAIEDLVHTRLVRSPTVATNVVRPLMTILLIVPELERSGDLVEHIALRTPQGMAGQLSARARGLIEQMGEVGVDMWRAAANAYADRDPGAGGRLRLLDDHLDDLHVSLSTELAQSPISTSVAIEMGLVARFLERLGDHAVNVAQRLRDLCTDDGWMRSA